MMIFTLIHLFSVLIWVGGMFFAYMILRPAVVETLEPPLRLRLWNAVFRRFFNWVWGAVVALSASGFYMVYLFGGIVIVPRYVHIMLALGVLMIGIYSYVYFVCYRAFSQLVTEQSWKEAGEMLAKIRQLVALNLTIGLLVVAEVFIGRANL